MPTRAPPGCRSCCRVAPAVRCSISNARAVVIVTRETPATGIDLTCPPAGEAELRALSIDLDQRDPRARYQSTEGREFGFTLEQGEIETFVVTATANNRPPTPGTSS